MFKITPRVATRLNTIGYKHLRTTPSLIYSIRRTNMSSDAEPHAVEVTYPEDGITVITINREKRRNAVDAATATKLYNAIVAYEEDPKAKVAIFRGANGTFCAGYDLHTVGDAGNSASLSSNSPSLDANERSQGPMGPSRLHIKKPIIAAVSGYAVAGGLELSLLGDFRVAEEDAVFGVFCRRWGVPLLDGGTVRLQAVVGLGRAQDMILTGRPVDAREALSMGLANRVVPKGQSLDEAMKIAQQLLKFPWRCMNADRLSCYHAAFDAKSMEEALKFEFDNGLPVLEAESIAGAGRFSKGAGRGGDFSNL
jgi:enoyl-CoA hydratase/carnithine racemase